MKISKYYICNNGVLEHSGVVYGERNFLAFALLIEREKMRTIEISDELFFELQRRATGFYVTPEDVIWGLIKNENQNGSNAKHSIFKEEQRQMQYVVYPKGGMIPCPLKLRMEYKRTIVYGETKDGWIWFENQRFKSPSQAACYVAKTKGAQDPSINGWTKIEYFDEDSKQWYYLDNLRHGTPGIEIDGSNVTGRQFKQFHLSTEVVPSSKSPIGDTKLSWIDAILKAINRYCRKHNTQVFTYQQFIKEELEEIIKDTHSTGKTPANTLRYYLQNLRDQGKIEFIDNKGSYRLRKKQ